MPWDSDALRIPATAYAQRWQQYLQINMEQIYKDFESKIKTKHSFNWTPKFGLEIETKIKKELITEIASKAIEKLDWDIVYKDKEKIEAKRKNSYGTWTEKITLSVLRENRIEIKSVALGNEMWDLGRNSKRAKLLEYAYRKEEETYDIEQLEDLQKEVESRDNWDDYKIPESLPQPKKRSEPNFVIPAIGGLIVSVISAYTIAYISVKGIYVIGLFEFLVGFMFGFTLKYLIRLGNFTNSEKLQYLLYAMVGIFFIANQIFQYEIIKSQNNLPNIGLIEFIKIRLTNGLKIKSLNTGWIGLVISWVLQVLLIYWISILRTFNSLISFQMEKVPKEVTEFAIYHFVKGKDEQSVRQELYKMGWTTDIVQTEVFESIGAVGDGQEMARLG